MTPVEKDPNSGLNAAMAGELRAERAASKITFDTLAERSQISKRTLIRLLQAERHIDVAALDAIAEAFGLSAQTLLSRAQTRLESQRSIRRLPTLSSVDKREEWGQVQQTAAWDEEVNDDDH